MSHARYRRHVLLGCACLLALAGGVHAAAPPPTQAATPLPEASPDAAETDAKAQQLLGKTVLTEQGVAIGQVTRIVRHEQNGQLAAVITGQGLAGMDELPKVVRLDQLRLEPYAVLGGPGPNLAALPDYQPQAYSVVADAPTETAAAAEPEPKPPGYDPLVDPIRN